MGSMKLPGRTVLLALQGISSLVARLCTMSQSSNTSDYFLIEVVRLWKFRVDFRTEGDRGWIASVGMVED